MEKMNFKNIQSDNKPPPHYRCKRCGSPDHYYWKCPLSAWCCFCYARGHLADRCFVKLRKEEYESTSREGQNQQVLKRKIIASQSSSDDEAQVVMDKRSRENARSNLAQE